MTSDIVPYIPKRNTIYAWDALQLAQHMPSESVNCIVTSPPYFGLRDYGIDGQIGQEESPAEYVDRLVEVFRELRRVLRSDGTLWLNLGDSFAQDTKWGGSTGGKHAKKLHGSTGIGRNRHKTGLPGKNLIGIPWRVAFALQEDGWILRSDIIWAKGNPMPEPVEDRPSKSHEYIFLLSKSKDYFYDYVAIREENVSKKQLEHNHKYAKTYATYDDRAGGTGQPGNVNNAGIHSRPGAEGRNKPSVWTVNVTPFPGAHFATFPQKLVELMLSAGSPKECCSSCGAPYQRLIEKQPMVIARSDRREAMGKHGRTQSSGTMLAPTRIVTLGFAPTCNCNAGTRPGLVYDPFGGVGTTRLVAQKLGRDCIMSELNPEYAEMARARVDGRLKEYLAMKEGKPYMEGLFTA